MQVTVKPRVGRIEIEQNDQVLTPDQAEKVQSYEWNIFEVPPAAEVSDPDGGGTLRYYGRCDTPLALYLYAADGWAEIGSDVERLMVSENTSREHTCALIWDARVNSDDDPIAFPVEIESSTGTLLRARAATVQSVFDWPVHRGDRVFMAMSDTRLAQLATLKLDAMHASVPEEFEAAVRKLGTSGLRDKLIEYYRVQGHPDLVHVTDALLDEIQQRQAFWREAAPMIEQSLEHLFGKAVADRARKAVWGASHGGVIGVDPAAPAPPAPAPGPNRAARRRTAARARSGGGAPTAAPSERLSRHYTRIATAFLRGDVAADGPVADALGIVPGGDPGGDRGVMTGFEILPDEHWSHNRGRLPPDTWAAMRDDDDYCIGYSADISHVEHKQYTLHVSIEWCGLRFAMRGLGDNDRVVAVDMGAAVFCNYRRAGDSEDLGRFILRFWGVSDGIKPAGEYGLRIKDHPGELMFEAGNAFERLLAKVRRADPDKN